MRGKIIKGIAGFYYVKSGETVYRCRARGIFKERGIRLTTGDSVELEILEGNDDSLITELLPRKNVFVRPFVANVDCFAIVASLAKPEPVFRTIDRFLVMAEKAGTEIVVCISKCDLADCDKSSARKAAKNLDLIKSIYELIYPTVCLDSVKGTGFEKLNELLRGKTVALAGASGVGKSTILNLLVPGASMETGSVSRKSQRGRHTTRHSELFSLEDGFGTMIFDTPGFASFDILDAEEEELQYLYPDIARYSGDCRYDNCRHLAEPGCRVKEALERGEINPHRYESYRTQMEEIRK